MEKDITYTTDDMVYFATQYLVSAVKSYANFSIVNFYNSLEFCNYEGCLKTKPFNDKGDQLRLHYKGFILEWYNDDYDINAVLFLKNKSHNQITKWISKIAYAAGIDKPFKYEFHSANECPLMYKEFKFTNINSKRLAELSDYRLVAQEILNEVIDSNQLESEVCSWTTNFNTVTYALLNPKTDVIVALGITKPKAKNEQKIYVSGWQGLKRLKNKKIQDLSISKNTNGEYLASIPFSINEKNKALNFFKDVLNIFRQEYYLEVS